jgi:AraC-like DNA-binding protein
MATTLPQPIEHSSGGLRLRLMGPPSDLAPYVSAYYRTEIAPGAVVEDWLPPEEANIRTGAADVYEAVIGNGALGPVPPAVLSGPTDRVTRLRIGGGAFWGIGLTPAGWARFIRKPASDMANTFRDIHASVAPPSLAALLDRLREDGDDVAKAWKWITETFRALLGTPHEAEDRIREVHQHILSPDAPTASGLASEMGMTTRTFERFCKRQFGFTPRALVRRQRFLRSLGKYMLDPSMRWISSLDTNYSDQSHFIREFRAVMGMTPSEYAAMPHPISAAAVAVTNSNAGVAMQALYSPEKPRGGESGV